MDKQIKEELTKIYEQIGALLSTDESDKIKKFGTLQILGGSSTGTGKTISQRRRIRLQRYRFRHWRYSTGKRNYLA